MYTTEVFALTTGTLNAKNAKVRVERSMRTQTTCRSVSLACTRVYEALIPIRSLFLSLPHSRNVVCLGSRLELVLQKRLRLMLGVVGRGCAS
jgi:hypothetical protein